VQKFDGTKHAALVGFASIVIAKTSSASAVLLSASTEGEGLRAGLVVENSRPEWVSSCVSDEYLERSSVLGSFEWGLVWELGTELFLILSAVVLFARDLKATYARWIQANFSNVAEGVALALVVHFPHGDVQR
jgi:hypothetical protein